MSTSTRPRVGVRAEPDRTPKFRWQQRSTTEERGDGRRTEWSKHLQRQDGNEFRGTKKEFGFCTTDPSAKDTFCLILLLFLSREEIDHRCYLWGTVATPGGKPPVAPSRQPRSTSGADFFFPPTHPVFTSSQSSRIARAVLAEESCMC